MSLIPIADGKTENHFFWHGMFFLSMSLLSLVTNCYLYHVDFKYHNGRLSRVNPCDQSFEDETKEEKKVCED